MVFKNTFDDYAPMIIELIDIVEKHNNLITITCDTYLCILEFILKVYNTALIIPSFTNSSFSSILPQWFKNQLSC